MLFPQPHVPLIVENLLKASEGMKDWVSLASWLGTFSSSSLKDAMEQFVQGQGRYQPSWRAVIFALDKAGDTPVANCIRSYGEPVQGRYMHTSTQKYNVIQCHAIPQHVYHHNSVGCSTVHIINNIIRIQVAIGVLRCLKFEIR